MNLRTKNTLFFGTFLVVVALGVAFYSQSIVSDIFKKQTIDNFRIIAEQTEGAYIAYVNEMRIRTLDLASESDLEDIVKGIISTGDGTPQHAQFVDKFSSYKNVSENAYDKNIYQVDLLDAKGIIIASTHPEQIGLDAAKEEDTHSTNFFSQVLALNPGETAINSFLMDTATSSEPMTHVATRMFVMGANKEEKPLPVVLVVHFANAADLMALLMGSPDGSNSRVTSRALLESYKTSEVYLVNRDGLLVTPSRYSSVASTTTSSAMGSMTSLTPLQKISTPPVVACLEHGQEVDEEYTNYRGVQVLGASMCLENAHLVLVLEVQKGEIFGALNTLTAKTTAGIVLMFILGILLVVLLVRRPLARVNEIVASLEKVMNGDFDTTIPVETNDEMSRLASMFNTMVQAIRSNQKDLQESKRQLEEKAALLEKDLGEHEKQEKFLEESKRATLNLLEDSWKAKEKLEEEGNKLQTILSSIGDGLILVDTEYKIVLINTKAQEIFQMPQDGLVGRDLHDVIKLYKNRKIVESDKWPMNEVFLTKKAITTTIEEGYSIYTDKLGVELPIAFSVAPISGRLSGVVIVFRDVTADRELDEAKSGFISVASHQLRTPLTSIRWYSEMLLSEDTGPLNSSQKDFVEEIHGGADRLYKTVDLLLGLSRIEGGKIRIIKSPTSLSELTADIVKEVSSQIREKNIVLTVKAPEGEPVVVWLDSLILRQVILNLFSNAINYSNDNGTIDVTWGIKDGKREVVYSVSDSGIGIPENQRARIFSKFFRAENARVQVPDGSGLGLALVKNLVESWHGHIWFESEQNKGSTFFFTIPLTTSVEALEIKEAILK